MTDLTFRQLKVRPDTWKSADAVRPWSPFSAPYSKTLALLDKELDHLDATNTFLQVEMSDPVRGVRQDGMIRAGAKVVHPGVILTIETRELGTLVYPCDAFTCGSRSEPWQENLRAIALGLEALRRVERYGIADRGQQYAGFAELGSGTPMGSGVMSVDVAADLLAEEGGGAYDESSLLSGRGINDTYRFAARRHHPDAGGDPEMFRRLTEARDLLLRVTR